MPESSKEEMQRRAQLVRVFESSCKVEYPSTDELNFRIAIAKTLGVEFGLREVKDKTIAGPVTSTPQRPAAGAKQR